MSKRSRFSFSRFFLSLRLSFFKNFGLKFSAFVVAVIIWLVVLSSKSVTKTLTVPLVISKNPNLIVVNEDVPQAVQVEISGSKAFIRNVTNRNYSLEVDITGSRIGRGFVNVPIEQIDLPSNVRIQRVTPSRFEIDVDTYEQRKVPVRLSTLGELPGEERITNVDIEPREITLSGPSRFIKNINEVRTETIDLGTVRGSITRETKLVAPSSHLIILDTSKVNVSFEVEGGVSNIFRLKNIPINQTGAKTRMSATFVTVVVRTSLDNISADLVNQIRVIADLTKIPKNYKGKVSLSIQLPKELRLIRMEPDSIRIH